MPQPDEDEDLLDDLPPIGDVSSRDDDETFSADELGVEIGAGPSEDVGLDDSTGLDDEASLFVLELPPREQADEQGVDDIPLAETLGGDDEYGWTEDAGSAADEKWDPGDVDLPRLTPLGRDSDHGAEGVDEVFELGGDGDDSVPFLPPLRGELEDGEEDGLEVSFPIDDALVQRRSALPPALEGVSVEAVLPVAAHDVAFGPPRWTATSDGIYVGAARCDGRGLRGVPRSICVSHGVVLVGTELGAFRSEDGAATFEPIETLGTHRIDLTSEREGTVWACGATGRLQRSDDGGRVWSPPLLLTRVVAMATPERGVVALSAPESARAQVAASTDGGGRWAAFDAPALTRPDDPGGYSLAMSRDDVALASAADDGGPFLSHDRGQKWLRIPGVPPARAVLLTREDALVIYAAHEVDGRHVVVRYLPDRESGSGIIYEGTGTVNRLLVDPDGGIQVATEDGLFRVRVSEAS